MLDRPDARDDLPLFVRALSTGAGAARIVDTGMAQRLGEEAVEIARGLDDERLLATALCWLGGVYLFAGQGERGAALASESLGLADKVAG